MALCIALAAASACVGSIETSLDNADDPSPGGDSAAPYFCSRDQDCVPAAPTCCECPTFAVSRTSPVARACANVPCPASECTADVVARCSDEGRCELACAPRACEPTASCMYGFATDASGCLTCDCAAPEPGGCTADSQCTQTRADCCGCQQGGFDTAVLVTDRARFDAMLMCPASPACPGISTCTADEPTCIAGRCELITPDPPPGACGRPDLPACPADTACLVNVSDPANMHHVGVCGSPP
ncbi:MAG TPA: hypothetical protein VNO30_50475 [Kofleriaceae bacterium]|nr:hypothetical protein [Kofleriaceae bacterium]